MDLTRYRSEDEVPLVCDFCDKTFTRKKRNIVASLRRAKYTSTEHPVRCRQCAIRLTPGHIQSHCLQCSANIPSGRKFCTHSCAATYNNKGRKKPSRKTNTCEYCGELYNKVCTPDCESSKTVAAWKDGKISGNAKYQLKTAIRDYVLSRAGWKCEECGYSKRHPTTGNTILHVDHIDGSWENSRPDNLRVLCPNCHALTDTYGALNMGKGRKWKTNYSQY